MTVTLDSGKRVTMSPVDVLNFKERLFGMMIMEPNPYTFIKMIIAILSKNYSRKGMSKLDAHAYAVVKGEAEYESKMLDFNLEKGSQFDMPNLGDSDDSGDLTSMSIDELLDILRDPSIDADTKVMVQAELRNRM
jgi:hypothetical protein